MSEETNHTNLYRVLSGLIGNQSNIYGTLSGMAPKVNAIILTGLATEFLAADGQYHLIEQSATVDKNSLIQSGFIVSGDILEGRTD